MLFCSNILTFFGDIFLTKNLHKQANKDETTNLNDKGILFTNNN